MSEFTPGPWEVVCNRNSHWGMREVKGPGVSGYLLIGFTSATDVTYEKIRRIESDARLIAAAPDLLQACREALECEESLSGGHDRTAFGTMLRAAISKAAGQPTAVDGKE